MEMGGEIFTYLQSGGSHYSVPKSAVHESWNVLVKMPSAPRTQKFLCFYALDRYLMSTQQIKLPGYDLSDVFLLCSFKISTCCLIKIFCNVK